MAAQLPLRDVHLSDAPGWWPLAPGWWALLAMAVILLSAWLWWSARSRQRHKRLLAMFDAAIAQADSAAARLAAASELLRRAAPDAQHLSGEQWLAFLDGGKVQGFCDGAGRLLLDGGFRREVDAQAAAQACSLARQRFIELMALRR